MINPFSQYLHILKRWFWVIFLGITICGSVTYFVSKKIPPAYQASANLILNECTTQTTPYDCTTAGIEALPTYAQLVTSSTVLSSVVAQHPGLTVNQLSTMVAVKPQSNTSLIEVDVTNSDPQLAMDLANEICQSFAQFSITQLPGTVQVIPAELPINPSSLKASTAGLFGSLVGLGLSLTLIVIFEWVDDRPRNIEDVQRILGMETLVVIPRLARGYQKKRTEEIPALAEGSRMLSSSISARQATKPCRFIMITSALAGEGKSTIAANLGLFLTMAGEKVLLVDANMRAPWLHIHYKLENYFGLAEMLSNIARQAKVDLEGQETEFSSLHVLTAGMPTSNPADLLQSPLVRDLFEEFERTDYDYVIFDAPPLIPVADARILATYVQAIILVTDVSGTSRKLLLRVKELLDRTDSTVLGVALNKSQWSETSDIRDYLEKIRHHQRSVTAISSPSERPQLPLSELTKMLPKTPPVYSENGDKRIDIDSNVTVKVHRIQQDEDE